VVGYLLYPPDIGGIMRPFLTVLAIGIASFTSPYVSARPSASAQEKKTADSKPQPGKKADNTDAKQVEPASASVKQTETLPPLPHLIGPEHSTQMEQALSLLPIDSNDQPQAKHRLNPAQHLASQIQSALPEAVSVESLHLEPGIFLSADPDNLDMLWPVETRTISSAWGPRVRTTTTVVKTSNGNRRIRKPYTGVHRGIDLTAPKGHSIFAAMDGLIVAVGRNKNLGMFVRIDHGNGVETVYGHNSANLVKVGDLVRRGQIIARVGNTGHSTGPHVHFEVLIDSKQVNPAPLLNDTEEIPAEILAYNEKIRSTGRSH